MGWMYTDDLYALREKITNLEARVAGFEATEAERPGDDIHEFARRNGAVVGENVWQFLLEWAKLAEGVIDGLEALKKG